MRPDQQIENLSEVSSNNSIEFINMSNNQQSFAYNLKCIPKNTIKFLNSEKYTDEQFKLKNLKEHPTVKIKRLCSVFPVGTPLFIDLKNGKKLSEMTKKKFNLGKPSYLSEINMLPVSHYERII